MQVIDNSALLTLKKIPRLCWLSYAYNLPGTFCSKSVATGNSVMVFYGLKIIGSAGYIAACNSGHISDIKTPYFSLWHEKNSMIRKM